MTLKFGNMRKMLSLAIAVVAASQNSTSAMASVEETDEGDEKATKGSRTMMRRPTIPVHCSMSKSMRRMRVARGFRRRR